MAKLSTADRKKLKPKEFLGPHRTFPGEDRSHLEAAIRDAPHSYHAGNITKGQESHIVREARAKLHKRLGVLPRKHVSRGR